jgi:hypothetical protein
MKRSRFLLTALTLVFGGQLFRVMLPELFYYAVPTLGLGYGKLVASSSLCCYHPSGAVSKDYFPAGLLEQNLSASLTR